MLEKLRIEMSTTLLDHYNLKVSLYLKRKMQAVATLNHLKEATTEFKEIMHKSITLSSVFLNE